MTYIRTELENNSLHEHFNSREKLPDEKHVRDGDVFLFGGCPQLLPGTKIFPNRKNLVFIRFNLANCEAPESSRRWACQVGRYKIIMSKDDSVPPETIHLGVTNIEKISKKERDEILEPFMIRKEKDRILAAERKKVQLRKFSHMRKE